MKHMEPLMKAIDINEANMEHLEDDDPLNEIGGIRLDAYRKSITLKDHTNLEWYEALDIMRFNVS